MTPPPTRRPRRTARPQPSVLLKRSPRLRVARSGGEDGNVAEGLGVDRETASRTYYACLLSHAGCTAEAHVAAEVFGGSMTTHFNPRMYGSAREVFTGLLRALPDPADACS